MSIPAKKTQTHKTNKEHSSKNTKRSKTHEHRNENEKGVQTHQKNHEHTSKNTKTFKKNMSTASETNKV